MLPSSPSEEPDDLPPRDRSSSANPWLILVIIAILAALAYVISAMI